MFGGIIISISQFQVLGKFYLRAFFSYIFTDIYIIYYTYIIYDTNILTVDKVERSTFLFGSWNKYLVIGKTPALLLIYAWSSRFYVIKIPDNRRHLIYLICIALLGLQDIEFHHHIMSNNNVNNFKCSF